MTNIDQFESVFKAASKLTYRYRPLPVRSVMVVTDLDEAAANAFSERVRSFLQVLSHHRDGGRQMTWQVVTAAQYESVGELLALVEQASPDLLCTYRNLRDAAWRWEYSLGAYLDVLAQLAPPPVLVLPHPDTELPAARMLDTNSVMAMTDHLAGDDALVSAAVDFTEPNGTLLLAHVEDQATLERYLAAIGKIPEIDTDVARERITEQLLKEPRDYIATCAAVLREMDLSIRVSESVTLGHHVADYRRLVDEHQVDLLVLNTKDEDQLAMHGMAYPLSVELRDVPVLML
ncbi:MAG: hypothetical protein IIA67_03025 [Planctomycetes bacterium]|nr:hypothetical protein [Planctomycetota bacterium]